MKVLANDGISPVGQAKLEENGFTVETQKVEQDQLADYILQNEVAVLLVRSATKVRQDLIDQVAGTLKFIGRGGVGLDNIDVDYARNKDIFVTNTPAASTRSVAELVMAHLSGMIRFLHISNQQMPLEGETKFKELKKNFSAGIELQGKTLGIVGFGRIGQEVAKIALGYGMQVKAVDPQIDSATVQLRFFDDRSLDFEISTEPMDKVLKNSDFITVHVGGAGKALIGEDELEMMKDGAGIVNTSRGGVVDETALLEALDSGKLGSAALDVFENEPQPALKILMNGHTSLSPHIGAATLEAQDRIGLELADLIIEKLG